MYTNQYCIRFDKHIFPNIRNNTFTHSLGRKDYGEGVGPVGIVFSSDGD